MTEQHIPDDWNTFSLNALIRKLPLYQLDATLPKYSHLLKSKK